MQNKTKALTVLADTNTRESLTLVGVTRLERLVLLFLRKIKRISSTDNIDLWDKIYICDLCN